MAEEATELRERASVLAKWDLESLTHPKQGAPYDFEAQRQLFEDIRNFYADVASANFKLAPPNILNEARSTAENLIRRFESITNFNAKEGNPADVARSLVASLQTAWGNAYSATGTHLAIARTALGSLSDEIGRLKSLSEGLQTTVTAKTKDYEDRTKAADDQLKGRINELENVVAAAREASKIEAVAAQAQEFQKEAEECLSASRYWFWATIVVVVLSLVAIWFLFLADIHSRPGNELASMGQAALPSSNQPVAASVKPVPPNEPIVESKPITAAVLQQTVARVLVMAILYSAVVWCARNFFACKHNYTVNRHRRNAMQTFRAFVAGTKDPATQDFILRQAATCAFAPQQSGYLKDESLPTPGPATQIIDVVKPEAK